MKVFLLLPGGGKRSCRVPFTGADHALAKGACPNCGAEEPGPASKVFKIAGCRLRPSDDDRAWECDAACLACKSGVGTVRAEMDTLFGVREDEAVLNGRARVY
jgi:hypothetical protein